MNLTQLDYIQHIQTQILITELQYLEKYGYSEWQKLKVKNDLLLNDLQKILDNILY